MWIYDYYYYGASQITPLSLVYCMLYATHIVDTIHKCIDIMRSKSCLQNVSNTVFQPRISDFENHHIGPQQYYAEVYVSIATTSKNNKL